METVTEKSGAMQAGPIEITERVGDPPPPVKPSTRVTYQAMYEGFEVEIEMAAHGRIVSAHRSNPNAGFASTNPPVALLDPAFAAWLEQFMAECQRRYDARTAEGRS